MLDIKFRTVETFGVRQTVNIDNVLMVESDGGLVCMHFAPLLCQVHMLHQSASWMERDSTLTVSNLGNDEDRNDG